MKISTKIYSHIQKLARLEEKKIPSEFWFAKKFNCSRSTVSQALKEIAVTGFIYSKHGSGWFISNENDDIFLKSISEKLTFDKKEIAILKNKDIPTIFCDKLNHKVDHYLKVVYLLEKQIVTILYLGLRKWEVSEINIDELKKSTNKIYKKTIIHNAKYEILFENNSLIEYQKKNNLNAPVVRFRFYGIENNLISEGFILADKEKFSFKMSKSWLTK